MAIKISKKYYIIPALYSLIIIALVYMHFGTTKQFLESYLFITLSGTTKSSNKNHDRNIASLDVIIYGIKLCFSNSMPLKIETGNGTVSSFFITGYQKNINSIDLLFTDNFILNISNNGSDYVIKPELNFNARIRKILISFDIDKRGTLLSSLNFPIFGYKDGGLTSFLTAGGSDSSIDIRQKEISLLPDTNNNFILTVSEAEKGFEDPNTFWLAKNTDILQRDRNEYIAEQLFVNNAYRGWRIERFNREQGKWLDKNRQPTYSKEIVSALGSELIRRREVAVNQWIFRLAESRNSEIKYLETALIIGNIIPAHMQMQKEDIVIIEEINEKIIRRDISVFLIDDLVKIITDRGPNSLIQELFIMAEAVDMESIDIKIATGIASAYLDFIFINMEKEISLIKFNTIVDTIILNRLILNESGFFITTTGDKSESFYTAKVSTLFKKAADITERPILERIGNMLVHSIILFADETGFLPEAIYVDKKSVKRTEGKIEPEYIYPALESARYMPSIRTLSNYFSPGTWIATCADNVNIIKTVGNNFNIETTFPIGETEYIIMQGIPPVSRILFFGINWSPDPDFERYFTGWTYNIETQTLFIKLLHRQEKEIIEIYF